jgi:hypothetical protein
MPSPQAETRHKSCLECVKAKRRCGKQYPTCQRCENKGLGCQYSARQAAKLAEVAASTSAGPSTNYFQLEQQWLEPMDAIYPYASSSSVSWGNPLEMSELLDSNPPSYLVSAEPGIKQMSRSEMEFCVSQFVEYPSAWLKSGSAPFIQPSLYPDGIPAPLKAAYSAAAVYTTITPENSSVAWTVVETLADSILENCPDRLWSTEELLARVQALCVVQIIRLFGPDIRQRHLAEIIEPTLSAWTESLTNQTALERTVSAGSAQNWRAWLLAESIRRTIIMSLMIRGVYALVKTGFCNLGPAVTALSFTAQKRMWNARSAGEWRLACREGNEYWVNGMQFGNLLTEGTKPDVEEMGILMSVTYCGRVRVEEWLCETEHPHYVHA